MRRRHRRPGRHIRTSILSGLAIFLAAILAYGTYAVVAPVPPVEAQESTSSIQGRPATVTWPSRGVAAVGVVGADGLIAQHGSNSSIPTASMAKTVTALVLLAKKPLSGPTDEGPKITFTAKDLAIEKQVIKNDGSWAPVKPGVAMTERQALEAMLLPSANNYAISLADWAFGSVSAFTRSANAWLGRRGITHTHMADASGLSANTRSTPADLVAIGKLVRANAVLSSIVATKKATVPGAGTLHNTNGVLGVDGIDGVKTGSTKAAGYCLMFSTTVTKDSHTVTIVGVVAGEPSFSRLFSDVTKLVASLRSGFREVDLAGPGITVGEYQTPWGQAIPLVVATPTTALVWSNTHVTVRIVTRTVTTAPAGTTVGAVTFRVGRQVLASRTVQLGSALGPPPLTWLLAHPPERR
ncbi:MAG TPA: D-alanyl-D-alanine carboxypeptidase [Microbacteriaceae bacterium]|nr:D-alanyl-D-alanine carboxypeptidase [Microbacteriaceae bacterium]